MERIDALKVLRSYPGDQIVSDLYDQDNDFASALNNTFPGTFEYPDFSHLSIREVLKKAAKNDQERFEYTDPFADAKYSFDAIEQMISKCDELGSHRFQILRQDGSIIQANKVDGVWERDDDPLVICRQAQMRAQALAVDIERRIRADLKEDKFDVSKMSNEVRRAYREMGVIPEDSAEKGAMHGIETRNMAYAELVAIAKSSLMVDVVGINSRLEAARQLTLDVLSKEVTRLWVELDIRDFRKIQMSPLRKDYAGLLLAENSASNAEYREVLIKTVPDIVIKIEALDAENDRMIAAKEERKNNEFLIETDESVSLCHP